MTTLGETLHSLPSGIAPASTDEFYIVRDPFGAGDDFKLTWAEILAGIVGGVHYRGAIDASTNPNLPAANSGDLYAISVAGTVSGVAVVAGDMVLCKIDGTPANTPANWDFIQTAGNYAIPLNRTAVKTSAYNVALWDLVPCDTSGGAFAVTLPAASAGKGRVAVKLIVAGNTLTISLTGADHFNKAGGSTTLTLSLVNQGVVLESDGSGIWTVTADDLPLSDLDARYDAVGAAAAALTSAESYSDAGFASYDLKRLRRKKVWNAANAVAGLYNDNGQLVSPTLGYISQLGSPGTGILLAPPIVQCAGEVITDLSIYQGVVGTLTYLACGVWNSALALVASTADFHASVSANAPWTQPVLSPYTSLADEILYVGCLAVYSGSPTFGYLFGGATANATVPGWRGINGSAPRQKLGQATLAALPNPIVPDSSAGGGAIWVGIS